MSSFSNAKALSSEPLVHSPLLRSPARLPPKRQTRTWESSPSWSCPPARRSSSRDKSYRAPIDKVAIEAPAGLIDEGETPEEAAARELREETGYVAKVVETPPIMFNDPGFCNTNLRMVRVTVDMTLPENQNLRPKLEEDEFIEAFRVPLATLHDECKRLDAAGYAVDARVGAFAEGIEFVKRFPL
ncbi:MutT/nudix family protein [Durotheca rogersii]|uniref:MutT/nudix family protein n=1 Tax=Durotheca rogersii TaxID=419775 RepID=UPI00221F637A|nr:MutT/nudix family protein [Durotheca rogersii]KAI5867459.1 MutT/nudix family protein [Durotheca rogersii]